MNFENELVEEKEIIEVEDPNYDIDDSWIENDDKKILLNHLTAYNHLFYYLFTYDVRRNMYNYFLPFWCFSNATMRHIVNISIASSMRVV